MTTDVFGGRMESSLQPDEHGHYWVAIGTPECHCMRCMFGWGHGAEVCPRRPPVGHPGGPSGREVVDDARLALIVEGHVRANELSDAELRTLLRELRSRREQYDWMQPRVEELIALKASMQDDIGAWLRAEPDRSWSWCNSQTDDGPVMFEVMLLENMFAEEPSIVASGAALTLADAKCAAMAKLREGRQEDEVDGVGPPAPWSDEQKQALAACFGAVRDSLPTATPEQKVLLLHKLVEQRQLSPVVEPPVPDAPPSHVATKPVAKMTYSEICKAYMRKQHPLATDDEISRLASAFWNASPSGELDHVFAAARELADDERKVPK